MESLTGLAISIKRIDYHCGDLVLSPHKENQDLSREGKAMWTHIIMIFIWVILKDTPPSCQIDLNRQGYSRTLSHCTRFKTQPNVGGVGQPQGCDPHLSGPSWTHCVLWAPQHGRCSQDSRVQPGTWCHSHWTVCYSGGCKLRSTEDFRVSVTRRERGGSEATELPCAERNGTVQGWRKPLTIKPWEPA